ncbi:unnamed protein product [Fraxinus pennsylvanica]|uniref:Wax synthase domain-containing protein n=1 Tax=Fraxinus pennsylvanica TaxID=56036 RepID=A0AAD2AJX1_9LAMI|nr:unnamed protein product [Fraxinus pennsylvanica]
MEGEIKNFIMVWSSVILSVCYCYAIAKLTAKGTTRLCMFMPAICLFFVLPMNLNSVNLGCATAFFVTWLTNSKLLLLAFGTGPLSNPSLSLSHFVVISCLPVVIQHQPTTLKSSINDENSENSRVNGEHMNPNMHRKNSVKSLLHYGKKVLFLIFLLILNLYRHKFHRDLTAFMVCLFTVVGLEVILGVAAVIGQFLLRTEVEPPFNDPYFASSLKDFWGRRWNRVSSNTLRLVVFHPILKKSSMIIGPNLAVTLALLGTFVVSALMHEIIFYYIGRVTPRWGTTSFFLMQGLCLIVENNLREKISVKWRVPRLITGPLVFGFVVYTFMRLVLPELLEYNVDERAIAEYAAVVDFVKDASLYWGKFGTNFWYKTWKETAYVCQHIQ